MDSTPYLTQEVDGEECVIAYASCTLSPAERNYSVTEMQSFPEVWSIRKMRPYLEGYHFAVITDNQSLKWLRRMDSRTILRGYGID